MQVYIHYNLHGGKPEAHAEVKAAMLALYYFDNFKLDQNPTKYNLPNTSLWHNNKLSLQAAIDDLTNIVKAINKTRELANQAKIIRCVVLPFDNPLASPGDSHAT